MIDSSWQTLRLCCNRATVTQRQGQQNITNRLLRATATQPQWQHEIANRLLRELEAKRMEQSNPVGSVVLKANLTNLIAVVCRSGLKIVIFARLHLAKQNMIPSVGPLFASEVLG